MVRRRIPCYVTVFALALASSALQCSSDRTSFEEPREAGSPAAASFVSQDAGGDATQANDANAREECSGTNTQIYVLSHRPDAIHRFDPGSRTSTKVGDLSCPVDGTFSMAIDRYNTAWIVFEGGRFVNIDLDNLRCREVVLNNPFQVREFGMGFAKNDTGDGETLFLWRSGLYKVDPAKLAIEWVGQTSLPFKAELTGTGEGRLFGFSPYNGVIAHLDKTTGDTLAAYRTSAVVDDSFAFAQWGGDFWLFQGRTVSRYSPATGEIELVVEDTGFESVGAGSSTCAPYKPVQ